MARPKTLIPYHLFLKSPLQALVDLAIIFSMLGNTRV